MISGFFRGVGEICGLLGYYAAYSGDNEPTFRENFLGPVFKGQKLISQMRGDRTLRHNFAYTNRQDHMLNGFNKNM